jgi:hypothetical protein
MTPQTPGERLVNLEARMAAVEEGVSNFRRFQTKLSTFVDTHEAREAERECTDKRRATIHFALLGMLLAIVSGCAIALFTWVIEGHHTVSAREAVSSNVDATAIPTHY